MYNQITMPSKKRIALVAHNSKKQQLLEWAEYNKEILKDQILCGTGTTASLINKHTGLDVLILKSGPLGGDAQISSMIAEGNLDILIFFWDGMTTQPHEVDVKALLRLATIYNVLTACNKATADFIISSILMTEKYDREIPNF